MIRFREMSAHEKDAATRIQTQLLKQVGALRKSQSFPTLEENVRTPPSPPRTRDSAHSTESSRRDWSGTHDEDFEDLERSRTPKFSGIQDFVDLV